MLVPSRQGGRRFGIVCTATQAGEDNMYGELYSDQQHMPRYVVKNIRIEPYNP